MASGFDRQFLDELCRKNDIVSTIGRYVNMERKGRTYWACCPFHREKTPSFSVDESRQFYHCFGCGESGDVIKFVEKAESLDFLGAVKLLAERAGMELPAAGDGKSEAERRAQKEKQDKLFDINRRAARRYHENLYSPAGKAALGYLEARGITKELVKRFGLGYSTGFSDIIAHLNEAGFSSELLREAGIAEKKAAEDGSGWYYDVFAGRLIFPIIDNFGHVVAFGGRILEKSDFAKYRNTGNTPIFDKSKTLYAHNLLKKANAEHNIEYVILAEGYIDVIALHKAGFDTAIASMGTSLTEAQARIIKRFSENVIISYDGDAAGQKATLRGLDILRAQGLNVKVIALPDGLDPDDYLKKYGREGFLGLISDALPLFDYKLSALRKEFDLSTSDGKTKFALSALALIKGLSTVIEREEYIGKLSGMTGYPIEALKKQLQDSGVSDNIKNVLHNKGVKTFSAAEKAARFLLHCFTYRYGFFSEKYYPDFTRFLSEAERAVYQAFQDPGLTIAAAMREDAFPPHVQAALSEICGLAAGYETEAGAEEYAAGCERVILIESMKAETDRLSAEYEVAAAADRPGLISRIQGLHKKIKDMKG